MSGIPEGLSGESAVLVTTDIAISFLGLEQARVLGTPWLIAHLEMTCRNTVKAHLLDGQDTVGTQVNVRHLAATPLGMQARFYARVVEVQNRRILFSVEAFDEAEKIAEGTHERAIIDVHRFASRVQSKLKM